MIKFKQLRKNILSEAYSRHITDKEIDKEFADYAKASPPGMEKPEDFYGDLDKARAEMKKDYHPGNSARPTVWSALRYPVRDGDYYFAFIHNNEKTNMKYNELLNDFMKDVKKNGIDSLSPAKEVGPDEMFVAIGKYLEGEKVGDRKAVKFPGRLGFGDTMTREEMWGACLHIYGKIREQVVQKEFFGKMFNRKDPHKHLRVGKRKKAPRFESVKESVNEKLSPAQMEKRLKLIKKAVEKINRQNMRNAKADALKMMKQSGMFDEEVNEAKSYPDRLIQKAVKIALDMGGNMTGAYKKIEKMSKGLADHSAVKNALRLANESVNEGFMKKMSKFQIKRKYGRVLKKAIQKGSLELPQDAEEALYMWAFDNGEIKTDDPDEFIEWLDNNIEDFA